MSRFIKVDTEKCIGCHSCEIACIFAHRGDKPNPLADYRPRIIIGALVDPASGRRAITAVTCLQCDEPSCVDVCLRFGMVVNDGLVQVDMAACDGCGNCVPKCEYGALSVSLTTIPNKNPTKKPKNVLRAYKCDLCSHRAEGPACIPVCPRHAIQIVVEDTSPQRK